MKKYKYFTFVIIFVLIGIIYQLYHVKQFNFGQGDFDIAIMLETETGKYKKTKLSQWPSEDEYIFNSDKSYCLNDSPLIWNNGNLTVNTKGSDRCFIYFKKLQSVSNEISKRILEFNGGKSSIQLKPEPDFSTRATTNEGMFATNDEYGTSYYFRGAVDNNWVYFGGHYWRIVRINGDGSIRLIYSGSEEPTSSEAVVMLGTKTGIGSSVINSTATGAEYAGYMYTPGQERGFNNNSAVKTFIDNWYNNNLKEYEEHIADSTFCNDKSLYTNINGTGPIKGVGLPSSGWWYFGASTRLISEKSPNLICTNKLDSFTVSDSTHGNAKLTNPIGMISADEAVFAGGNFQINNADYYLYVGQFFWTMSPAHVEAAKVRYLLRGNAWGVSSDRLADVASVVRPVINLKNDLEMEGTGKYNDPYRLVPITLAKKILANNGGKTYIESKTSPNFSSSPTINEGLYAMEDDYGTSYYFRGAVENNWVKFAGFYWRIVRINGNESIKLIYSGQTAPTLSEKTVMLENEDIFSDSFDACIDHLGEGYSIFKLCMSEWIQNNAKTIIDIKSFNFMEAEGIGYMYTTGIHRGHNNNSLIKEYLDSWYETKLIDYENMMVDFVVCNDRGFTIDNYIPVEFPVNVKYSDVYYRTTQNLIPTLVCNNPEDAYTVSDIIKGNGKLSYPIGLLTVDEALIAGITKGYSNFNIYLQIGISYWLMSPHNVGNNSIMMFVLNKDLNSGLYTSEDAAIRPVISLKPDVLYSGSGLWNDPYIIST